MQAVVYILLLTSACSAHFRDYESRNLIERDEPQSDMEGIVECPVCEDSQSRLIPKEECDIEKGNKRYKKCYKGTYVNKKCGNRLDCYRGPGETCTEKMEYDIYGRKCAHGYYCNSKVHMCTGLGYTVDPFSHLIISNRLYRYPLPMKNEDSLAKSPLFLA